MDRESSHDALSAATERRIDPQVTLDLLARQLFIADELRKASDEVAGIQAAEEWDGDRLLTDTYERFETMAREAVYAEIVRLREEANSGDE